MTLPIVDLAAACDQLTARNRALFEVVGGWVATEDDAATQRWFSTASHRHAWHAELWAGRRPAIPVDPVPPPAPATPGHHRVAWYLHELAEIAGEVDSLAAAVDAELDPSTARVTRIVAADLDELSRLAPSG